MSLDRDQCYLRNALCLAYASWAAYTQMPQHHQPLAQLGLNNLEVFAGASDSRGFIAANDKHIVIAFRGTEDIRTIPGIRDWLTNISYGQSDFRNAKEKVHSGFLSSWESVKNEVVSRLRAWRINGQDIWLTGHSMGGAIATIAAKDIASSDRTQPVGIFTFGAPRVGDPAFADNYGLHLHRFINEDDIVPHLPLPGIANRYQHAGTGHYLLPDGCVSSHDAIWNQLLRNVARILIAGVESIPQKAYDDHFLQRGYIKKLETCSSHEDAH